MKVYYNEFEPYAADWLENLIAAGHLPAGDVDRRDIQEVGPDDLKGYDQCHFFAGIGGWPLALELAGWQGPVWTGSCPCQPLSSARRGRTNRDADLWPVWVRLVAATKPRTVFGEQVAHDSDWLDRVCDDLEAMGYEIGAAVLPACSVGLDHARPRLFFVGHAYSESQPRRAINGQMARLSGYRGIARGVAAQDGLPPVMGQLRAYGNAIVPQVAAEFVSAYLETRSHDA